MKLNKILRENQKLPLYPKVVGSWDEWNKIRRSGEWNPTKLGNSFYCRSEGITNFKNGPIILDGAFICSGNKELKNLLGGPKELSGSYDCSSCGLTSLEGVPKIINGFFDCSNNKLTTLAGIHNQIKYIHETIYVGRNQIKSSVLGLLLIDRLRVIDGLSVVSNIMNRHIQGDKDVLECQEELISAGLKEFAKL